MLKFFGVTSKKSQGDKKNEEYVLRSHSDTSTVDNTPSPDHLKKNILGYTHTSPVPNDTSPLHPRYPPLSPRSENSSLEFTCAQSVIKRKSVADNFKKGTANFLSAISKQLRVLNKRPPPKSPNSTTTREESSDSNSQNDTFPKSTSYDPNINTPPNSNSSHIDPPPPIPSTNKSSTIYGKVASDELLKLNRNKVGDTNIDRNREVPLDNTELSESRDLYTASPTSLTSTQLYDRVDGKPITRSLELPLSKSSYFHKDPKPDTSYFPIMMPWGKYLSSKYRRDSKTPDSTINDIYRVYSHRVRRCDIKDIWTLYGYYDVPAIRDVDSYELKPTLIKKLTLCCYVFDFYPEHQSDGSQRVVDLDQNTDVTDVAKDDEFRVEMNIKKDTLKELIDYISYQNTFGNEFTSKLIQMVGKNIFRSVRISESVLICAADEDEVEAVLERAWSHLSLVYDLLLRFVVSVGLNIDVAKNGINHEFMLKFLQLFKSGDPREKEYLKTILHRIYSKFMNLRTFIRKSMRDIFYNVIYNLECAEGLSQLLEVLGSIVNGCAVPFRKEHISALHDCLIPLHKNRELPMFHVNLFYAIFQFIKKDPSLGKSVILGLLKYWPKTDTAKEMIYLDELDEILEIAEFKDYSDIAVPMLEVLGECIVSAHAFTVEKTIRLWDNKHVIAMITAEKHISIPVIVKSLIDTPKFVWHSAVLMTRNKILEMLSDVDVGIFEKCCEEHKSQNSSNGIVRATKWQSLISNFEASKTS